MPVDAGRTKTAKKKKKAAKSTKVRRAVPLKPLHSLNSQMKNATKKMVDQVLTRISPKVEGQLKQLAEKFENSPLYLTDIKLLGLKVLERTRQAIKSEKVQRAKDNIKARAKASRSKKKED